MMKRSSDGIDLEYDKALKSANLVERNANPNGVQILSLSRNGRHESEDIVELAAQIKNAGNLVRDGACAKLTVILDQIRFLQGQAEKILRETQQHEDLHQAACNFRKIPGKIYHLYKRDSGQTYFSMLSPEEWGSGAAHEYLGSYRLESDQSWTPLEELKQKNADREWATKLLNSKNLSSNLLSIEGSSPNDLVNGNS